MRQMRLTAKATSVRTKSPVKAPVPLEKVLQACAEFSSFNGELPVLRERVANTAREIFHGVMAGMMVRDGETSVPAACTGTDGPANAKALMEHARSFSTQAIEQKRLLNFRFSYRLTESEVIYHGLAQPMLTSCSAGVLLVVRKSVFAPAEVSAFSVLSNIARIALDNCELAGLYATQKQKLDQLLEISADLGTSRLETFFPAFVVRAADFLGVSRAFVALSDQGECRLRWAASKGSTCRLDIDISAVAKRVLDARSLHSCEDINQLSSTEKAQLRRWESDLKQFLGIPLLTGDGRQVGVLGFLDKKDNTRFSPEDVRRARVLGAEITVALEAAHNLQLSDQHRKRTEDLMEMALDLGSALRLPDFVKNFTERVASMIGAKSAILSLAQGNKVESVGFCGPRPERELQRKLNAAFSEYAERHPAVKITGSGVQALGPELIAACGWQNLTLVRLEGTESDLLGILALADISRELMPSDLNLLQALIVHASVALENSRLFTRITQSSRQWAEIFDSISDFIVVHDEHFEVLRVNRSLSEFIGVRPAELIGLSMRALVSIASDSPQPCPFCRAENESDEYLHPVLERTYLVSSSRIHGALDEGLQTVHVLKDITDRREAEQRYRELFDNVQEGVFFASPEGHFIEVNDALVRMLGYQTREEVLKLDLQSQVYVSGEQRDEITRQLHDKGAVRNFEVTLTRRDGSMIHALENAFVVKDGQGKIMQYRGVFLDITEVKNFQAQLQRERDFTSKILNNTQTMIMVADTAGLISYANQRVYEGGGFEQNELVGHRLDRIISPSHKKAFAEAFDASLHGLQSDNLELMIARGNGTQGKFSVNLSPMRDDRGEVSSVVVLMTDITDTSMIQAKLMHTEKMAAVGQLVSGVAHEVNNPLTAIMGFSDLLMENPDVPGSARKDLQVILEEAQRTKEIVQNLLSFARQRPPQRQPLQINSILRKTIALRSYDFANHGVQIVERFDSRLPDLIGDSHQLQQVFLNILNNAYDAVQSAGRPGLIEIETVQDGGWVEVLFRDNGEGIQHPERIFDPFFTTKEVGQGTGLGLSICYGIVREHEGEILCANNQETQGATFSVRLPIRTRTDLKLVVAAGVKL
ncbi:MAG: signal transduction histidine kinase, nitrogen specific, NtrB [Candidatus Angelobacter sp.]|nr:signal transduction histidine kinase, nitrogen specific, NtrB [Candidatus Angelobacter sp.]